MSGTSTTPHTRPATTLRVVLVAPLPPPEGGISTWTRQVVDSLAASSGLELRVLDTAVRWRAVTSQGPLLRFTGGSIHAVTQIVRLIWALLTHRPDVVHLCTSAGSALLKDCIMLRLCRWFGVASIVHFRFGRIPDVRQRNGTEWRWLRRAVRIATRAMVIDRSSEHALNDDFGDKTIRFPNFIDLNAVQSAVPPAIAGTDAVKRRSIVFVGHVLPTKGVRELVAACSALANELPHLTLEIVGPCADEFRTELINSAGTGHERWLHFTGGVSRSDALRKIAGADVFCLPTYTEGFPNTILEAMALGRIIVATPVGAIGEMLRFDDTQPCGIVAQARDVASLTAALRRALTDPAANEMAKRAQRRCLAIYDAKHVTPRLLRIWQSMPRARRQGIARKDAARVGRQKLLLINQVAGPLTVELLSRLQSRGWDCQVLCGEIETDAGLPAQVRVIRSVKLQKDRIWRRLLTWSAFSIHAILAAVRARSRLVLVVTNPPLVLLVMPWLSWVFGVRYALLIHDVYPDVAERMKLIRHDGLIARVWRRMSGAAMRRAASVITIGQSMRDLLAAHLGPGDSTPIKVIPTWVNTDFIRPIAKSDNPFVKAHGLEGKFVVMYSGAFGATHDLQTVIDAAGLLVDEPKIQFVLIGGGTQARRVEEQLAQKRLPNVLLLPFQPRSQIPFSMGAADCSIVCLDSAYGGVSVPSKTSYALAAGSAVLAVCPAGSELAELVTHFNCGIQIGPGDSNGLAATLRSLHSNPQKLGMLRHNARSAAETQFSLTEMDRLCHAMAGSSSCDNRSFGPDPNW